MREELKQVLQNIIADMGGGEVEVVVEQTTDLSHGDYTTNVAMRLAKPLKKNPLEIAKEIQNRVKGIASRVQNKEQDQFSDQSGQKGSGLEEKNSGLQDIEKVEVVPPGFINFYLSSSVLSKNMNRVLEQKEGFGMIKVSSQKRNMTPDTLTHDTSAKRIMVEFAHPNTHKAFHIGHLRNIMTGESIIRLLESQGHEVIRVNYQGDVGMHIAKAMYGLLDIEEFKNTYLNYSSSEPKANREVSLDSSRLRSNNNLIHKRVEFLGKAYAAGSKAYEEDPAAKEKIHDYNYLVYAAAQRFQKERGRPKSSTDYLQFVKGRTEEIDEVYEMWKETRQWSLDYFETIYKRVGTRFDRLYFEGECLAGVDIAKEAVKRGILEESDGAIIFNGKKYGIDTRVFVNSLGLPTYEGKELALATTQFGEFGKLDKLIHVLGPEQVSFTKVTFKVQELLGIQKDQQKHLVYGWVKLKHGKMSSRLGNVVLGEDLLEEAKKAVYSILEKPVNQTSPRLQLPSQSDGGQAQPSPSKGEVDNSPELRFPPLSKRGQGELDKNDIAEKAAVSAVKYAFLKVSTLNEIAYDVAESVNIQGDTGPYLQYTYARAHSVLRKAGDGYSSLSEQSESKGNIQGKPSTSSGNNTFNEEEKAVLRWLYRFPEVIAKAAETYSPNMVCEYLYDLASLYNTFYNKHSILGEAKKMPNAKLQMPNSQTTHNSQLTTQFRLVLTETTAQVLKNGLYLLGIETLERM